MNQKRILWLPVLLLAGSSQAFSMNLEDAIRHATENNPDILMAQSAMEAAEARIGQANAAFRPQLDVQSSYMRTNLPLHAFGSILNQGVFDFGLDFNKPGEVDNLNVTGSVTYMLYEGGGRRAQLEAAKAGHRATNWQREATSRQIRFAVIRAWNQVAQSKELLASQKSNVAALEQHLSVAQQQFEAGKFLKTEVLNLDVQLARAREGLVNAQLALELSREGLLNLLGSSDPSLLARMDPELADAFSQYDMDNLQPAERHEVLAARAQLDAARRGLDAAEAGKTPQIQAFANYQHNRGFELDGDGNHWMAGVAIQYQVYGGGKQKHRTREALAQVAQAEQGLRRAELAVSLDQRSAGYAWRNAVEAVEVTAKAVEQAEESANLYRRRFETGVILSSELIDVENRLTEARMRRAISLSQLAIAKANLLRAMGHL
jgi:outer membrane protein